MTGGKILSARELEVLQYISDGYTNNEMAQVFGISGNTVNTHRKNILRKLQLKNTALLIRFAIENKLIK